MTSRFTLPRDYHVLYLYKYPSTEYIVQVLHSPCGSLLTYLVCQPISTVDSYLSGQSTTILDKILGGRSISNGNPPWLEIQTRNATSSRTARSIQLLPVRLVSLRGCISLCLSPPLAAPFCIHPSTLTQSHPRFSPFLSPPRFFPLKNLHCPIVNLSLAPPQSRSTIRSLTISANWTTLTASQTKSTPVFYGPSARPRRHPSLKIPARCQRLFRTFNAVTRVAADRTVSLPDRGLLQLFAFILPRVSTRWAHCWSRGLGSRNWPQGYE